MIALQRDECGNLDYLRRSRGRSTGTMDRWTREAFPTIPFYRYCTRADERRVSPRGVFLFSGSINAATAPRIRLYLQHVREEITRRGCPVDRKAFFTGCTPSKPSR
jgi:hypothetical protein